MDAFLKISNPTLFERLTRLVRRFLTMMLYGSDLSYVHHVGFGTFAEQAAPALLILLREARIEGGLVVDLACGSGIWPAHATEAGFQVLGIDVSSAMINLARRTAPRADFVVGSAHDVGIPNCVAVTALGEGISYLSEGSDDLDLASLLRQVSDALAPGGMFIFDVVERHPGQPMRDDSSREGSDWKVEVEVREDPERRLLTRKIHVVHGVGGDIRRSVETHRLRTFDHRELVQLLAGAGFAVDVVRSYGAVELPPQRLGFIAYKQRRV